jgi:hypothetical protein
MKAYLDFNLNKGLSIVYTNNRSNHLWHDNHIAKMGVNDGGLILRGSASLLRLA